MDWLVGQPAPELISAFPDTPYQTTVATCVRDLCPPPWKWFTCRGSHPEANRDSIGKGRSLASQGWSSRLYFYRRRLDPIPSLSPTLGWEEGVVKKGPEQSVVPVANRTQSQASPRWGSTPADLATSAGHTDLAALLLLPPPPL